MPLTRRDFVGSLGLIAGSAALGGCIARRDRRSAQDDLPPPYEFVNDVHSQMNATRIDGVLRPASEQDVASIVRTSIKRSRPVAVCGGRHAGGGQQFLRDQSLVDLSGVNAVIAFDAVRGELSIGAGAQWPAVMSAIAAGNTRSGANWGIRQKQGGSDSLSLGGTLSANAHGRCLDSPPIVQDVERIRIVTPDGSVLAASRSEESELFRAVIGGYGMWGIVTEVTLRLEKRTKLQLRVETAAAENAVQMLESHQRAGAIHGDWQFAIDPASPDFLKSGLLTSYSPVDPSREVTRSAQVIDPGEFTALAALAHTQPAHAFDLYSQEWHRRSGITDWSDSWQTSDYLPDYHLTVDQMLGAAVKGTEVLSEFYVPRPRLPEFLARAATWMRDTQTRLIFGVVRLIRQDRETLLAWATEDQACIILNLHADHSPAGLQQVQSQLRGVAQIAVELDGRFYLTYGRFADRAQLLRAYPQLPRWIARKRQHDPLGTLHSDWFQALCKTIGE